MSTKACDANTFNFHAFDMMLIKNIEHTWYVRERGRGRVRLEDRIKEADGRKGEIRGEE